MKKVSVIITTFNDSKKCSETIKSVLEQSYKNIEIIVIDDFSSDFLELELLIKEFDDERIKLYRQLSNNGAPAARNKGAELAGGDVICFLDSDDIWELEKIEHQMRMYENDSIVFCKYYVAYTDSKVDKKLAFSHYDNEKCVINNLFGSNVNNLILQTSSLMIGKDTFMKSKKFNERLTRHQDFQFVIDLFLDGINFIFVDEALVTYVKNRNANANKKGWSLISSDSFISEYIDVFNKNLLQNFLINQLLGPSIKNNNIKEWYRLSVKYDCVNVIFFKKIISNIINRLLG